MAGRLPFYFTKAETSTPNLVPWVSRPQLPALAEYATIDDYEETSSIKVDGEGLDISKLGISQEIVSALSKRGITKLFPIQVSLFSLLL
jgi:superfamily II helicase